jgi:hypothetical protein
MLEKHSSVRQKYTLTHALNMDCFSMSIFEANSVILLNDSKRNITIKDFYPFLHFLKFC